eukprot:Colp12_sorted_trinity150504_noHs@16430
MAATNLPNHPPNRFECGICLDLYTNEPKRLPRVLACGHSFCTLCLTSLATKREALCPFDRKSTVLRNQSITSLPLNFAIIPLLPPTSAENDDDHPITITTQENEEPAAPEPPEPDGNMITSVTNRLGKLKYLHKKHIQLQTELQKEIEELEKKYLEKTRPFYDLRARIIKGEEVEEVPVLAEEVERDTVLTVIENQVTDRDDFNRRLPDFWLTAMKQVLVVDEMIRDYDEPVLKHISDITLHYLDHNPGYRLVFHFEPNEYLSNETLEKAYYFREDHKPEDYEYGKATATPIMWKEGKDVTKKPHRVRKRLPNGRRVWETEMVKRGSFFDFFRDLHPPLDSEDVDEDAVMALEDDYDVAEAFRTRIIPEAVLWYTGENVDDDSEYESYDEEDEDDSDSDSDSDDEGEEGEDYEGY